MINFLQNLREKKRYLLQTGQCNRQTGLKYATASFGLQERQTKKSHSQISGYNGHPCNKMPQLHKTEYSYKILSRLNSCTLPAFYRKIIDQVVIIVAKHSKTAYKIISEHLHCTVCHQIPLLGFRSLPDPPLGEFNITVSQNWFSFYLHNASINRTHY